MKWNEAWDTMKSMQTIPKVEIKPLFAFGVFETGESKFLGSFRTREEAKGWCDGMGSEKYSIREIFVPLILPPIEENVLRYGEGKRMGQWGSVVLPIPKHVDEINKAISEGFVICVVDNGVRRKIRGVNLKEIHVTKEADEIGTPPRRNTWIETVLEATVETNYSWHNYLECVGLTGKTICIETPEGTKTLGVK